MTRAAVRIQRQSASTGAEVWLGRAPGQLNAAYIFVIFGSITGAAVRSGCFPRVSRGGRRMVKTPNAVSSHFGCHAGDGSHGRAGMPVLYCGTMKAKCLLAVAALLASAAPLPAQDQVMKAPDLPAAAQRALKTVSRGEPIKSITRRVVDGRTVYDIELERDNAPNPRFRLTDDGLVLAGIGRPSADSIADGAAIAYDGIALGPMSVDPGTVLGELPPAVRETVKKESAGRIIADIDRETWQGRTVYEVEFEAPGRNPQIHVAEDGTVVRSESRREGQVSTTVRGLFMGTQLADTPPAVQNTIRREARDHAIRDIDVKARSGQRIYEVEIDEGRTVFSLHVAEDGKILHDTRAEAAGVKRG